MTEDGHFDSSRRGPDPSLGEAASTVSDGTWLASTTPEIAGIGAEDDVAPTGRMGKHTTVYLGGILLGRAVSLVMLPFYTHYLTPADYGVMQLLELTLSIIEIIAGTRIASGIHRYYFQATNAKDRKAVLSTALVLLAGSFAALSVVTVLVAAPLTNLVLGSADQVNLMRIAAINLGLQGLLIVPFTTLQLWKRSGLFTALTTIKLVTQLTLNIIFLAGFGMGVEGVFISTLVSSALFGLGLSIYLVRQVGVHVSPFVLRSLLRYGIPLVGTQFASMFVAYGDRYFLRAHADVTTVGLYSLAYQFGFIVVSLGYTPFSMVWEPTRFQIASRPDRDAQYSRAFIFMNVMLFTATVGTALFVRDFIVLMSQEAYHSAYLIVPAILAAYVLHAWSGFMELGILIRERTGFVTFANILSAIAALIGYELLIPRWLGWGAAIATVIAFLVRMIATYTMSQRLLPVRYEWAPVWRLVALSALFMAAGVLLPHPSVVMSIATRMGMFAVFLVALWHIDVITPDEKLLIRGIVRSPRQALAGLTS